MVHSGGTVAMQHILSNPQLLTTYMLTYNLVRIGSSIWDPIDLEHLVTNHHSLGHAYLGVFYSTITVPFMEA
jgi:hypothetical protein